MAEIRRLLPCTRQRTAEKGLRCDCPLLFALLAVTAIQVPTTPTSNPTFEVVSIKLNTSATVIESLSNTPSQFTATLSLKNLITVAYRIPADRLIGTPDWASDRFDVAAKIPNDAAAGQLGAMLQALLADRFKWKAHHETRDQPIYALVTKNGKPGSAVQLSKENCGPPAPPQSCGIARIGSTLKATGLTMAAWANILSGIAGRIVVDETNLDGSYDFEVQYAAPEHSRTDLPSIFTALEEQMGLKLESTRGPINFLVVDHVERPTPD